MIDLEGANGFGQFVVVDSRVLAAQRIEGQIVFSDEALAECHHGFAFRALLQGLRSEVLPAAARDDLLIHGDGAHHRVDGTGRQHRHLVLTRDDLGLGGELARARRCARRACCERSCDDLLFSNRRQG